jgi:hypothetical protein
MKKHTEWLKSSLRDNTFVSRKFMEGKMERPVNGVRAVIDVAPVSDGATFRATRSLLGKVKIIKVWPSVGSSTSPTTMTFPKPIRERGLEALGLIENRPTMNRFAQGLEDALPRLLSKAKSNFWPDRAVSQLRKLGEEAICMQLRVQVIAPPTR